MIVCIDDWNSGIWCSNIIVKTKPGKTDKKHMYLNRFFDFFAAGDDRVVEVTANIYIISMFSISEIDMVCIALCFAM